MAAITSAGRATGLEPLELAGDSTAAAALFERHSSRVFGYCLSRLGRREDAEDAVQTTFLHAVRGLRRGVVPATEVAWLLGIARNVCLSRWETAGRRSRLESPCDPLELERESPAPVEGGREELIGLEDALSKLPDRQRRAVLLRDWRGLSYDEVAEQLGVSRAAVETLIFRGRRTLAELLREEPPTIRRRLHSLGDLGSLFTAVKTTLAGGAAATKIAAAAVAGVALSGAGIVAGTSLQGGGPAPAQPLVAKPASPGSPLVSVAPNHRSVPTPARPVRAPRSAPPPPAAAPIARSAARTSSAATPAVPATSGPGPDVSASAEGMQRPRQAQPQPEPIGAVAPTAEVLPVVTTAVEQTVDTLLPTLPVPSLPVEVPPLPLPPALLPDLPATTPVTEVVAAVPAVVADLPVTVTLPPVEVAPPKLLP